MSGVRETKVSGFLYSEVARLQQRISEQADEHRTSLSTWTRKCGQMGNEIGRLRQQVADNEKDETERQEILSVWTKKCGQMGNEIGRLRQQAVLDKEKDTAVHQEVLEIWTKKVGEMGGEILRLQKQLSDKDINHRTRIDQINSEVTLLQERLANEEIEHQAEIHQLNNKIVLLRQQLLEKEMKRQTDLDQINNEIDILRHRLQNQNLHEHTGCNVSQINEKETDLSVIDSNSSQTNDNSESKLLDGDVSLNTSAGFDELMGGSQQVLDQSTTEQVQEDEEANRKSKIPFWATLKKHVTMKGKPIKSSRSKSSTLTNI